MTQPVTEQQRVIAAQIDGAAHSEGGLAVELPGEHHSPERIMFVHGAMTGHGVCTCPVVDEHGRNVNPGRAPLTDRRAAGRAEGSRKASETYARRRARKAADELAIIDPSLWDEETRRIVTTLATLAAPSRIDDVLAGELPVTLDELDRLVARLDADEIVVETVPRPEPRPYPQPRPRPDDDPRPRPEPHPSVCPAHGAHPHERPGLFPAMRCLDCPTCVHDNGDYRA